ncbi:hypothetical protein KPL71_004983 [Citrus sinensis]|uniref:Uncharacterized protein n=1 Tax=Citrus sinensis TaxID=2711 RepID=A0ACB8NA21_CITSI|nr:hypothetical protein KPL71_004983 [Citrus sinensis]
MVEGETSRIGEISTETISGDTSCGRRDLSNRYSTPVIEGQKIDVEKFDGKINFGMWRREHVVSMHDHVSRFEKLLADLKNFDEDIKDEVKAMILLHSLPEEYSHFVTTLIYGKSVIIFKDVYTTLTNLEIQNNDKNSERASSETLISRDWAMEKKERGHWRKDCPEAQKRDDKKPAAANMAWKDEDSDYSLSITHTVYVANSSEWIFDTGTTYHLCPIKEWFTDFRNLESGAVVMGNDQPCRTMGIGIIRLKMFDGMVRELKKVRFVPTLKKNLISVGALEAKGYKVTIEDGIMKFTHGAMVILQGVRRHNLYYLKGGTTDDANIVEAHSETIKLWHVRLGHAGEKSLQTLMRHGLLKGTKTCKLNFCEHCVVGKKTSVKFGTANHDTREILEYVHSYVWGPTKTASIGESHYFVTFVDDFSIHVWVYTMRANDRVLEIFVKWKKLVETQTGRKIKVLRSDNWGEYTSDQFLQVCQNEGIKRHFTVRHTPQQNGVAERMNRTLLEKVRCMLSNAGLDKKFWAEAVSYTSHLVNRLPSAVIGGKTHMEMWSGKHAQEYDSLRIFRCLAYYHVKDGKLDPRARKAIFVGFKGGVKGFKLWDLEDKKFVCSRDVTFDEASIMKVSSSQQVENNTKEVLQRVKFDATPYVPVSSTSEKGSTIELLMMTSPTLSVKHYAAVKVINGAEYELELAQLDVKTAFLHGDLEEEIYMIQPCGFKVAGKENRVQSKRHSHSGSLLKDYIGDDDSLVVGSDLDKFSPMWRIVEKSKQLFDMHNLLAAMLEACGWNHGK